MAENRIRDFKFKGKDSTEMRGRRRDAEVELRKTRREEQLLKKRNVDEEEVAPAPLGEHKSSSAMPTLEEIAAMIKSGDAAAQMFGTQKCRMMLSKEREPPINAVLEAGLVMYFVDFLTRDASPEIQFEAAWALTNIASGNSDQTMAVAQSGAVPHFVRLLSSPNIEVQEQSVWALGNICGDGPALRDMVLSCGILAPLLSLLQRPTKVTVLRNATWTLSNLCRGKKPLTNFAVIRPALPTLAYLITLDDKEVVTDACWALSYLTDGDNDRIKAVVNSGNIVPRLVELLAHPSPLVLAPALRAVGNIVTGDDVETQTVVDAGALVPLRALMSNKESIRKEVCWIVSNITAGNAAQISAVIHCEGFVPMLIEAVRVGDAKTSKEAMWALSNFCTGGTIEQIRYLVQSGCIQPMVTMLGCKEPRIVQIALDSFKKILQAGELEDGSNPCSVALEECGGLDAIEQLQQHENASIYHKALDIIETFFQDEDGESGVVPQDVPAFAFAAPVAAPTAFSF